MRFRFEAIGAAGEVVTGEVDAADADAAREAVWSRGGTPYVIAPAEEERGDARPRPSRGGRKVRDAERALFVRDLAILLQAGIALEPALRIASVEAPPRVRPLAAGLVEELRQGAALADAMARSGAFLGEQIQIARAGEAGGNLGGALAELAELLERRLEVRARLRAALAYPALLVVLCALSLSVVLGLLVPAVTPVFSENGLPLPAVLAALDFLRRHAVTLLAAAAAGSLALAAGLALMRRGAASRLALDRALSQMPVLGPIGRLTDAARFLRTLAALLRSGVPLLQALEAAAPVVASSAARRSVDQARERVREGVPLAVALARYDALPAAACQMIGIGEESGRLNEMLARAALILERQEQRRTARALAFLAPAVTILLAALIGTIILAVMGALLSLNELVLT